MKDRGCVQFEDLVCSFFEIWKFDKRLLLVLLINVVIKALQPFPNIILFGLIIDSITRSEDFSTFIYYIGVMFGINFFLFAVSIYLGKVKEILFLKFKDELDNDVAPLSA